MEKYGPDAAIRLVRLEDDVIMISSDGVIIRFEASSIRLCARPSKGVLLMRIAEGNQVVTVAHAPHEEPAPEEENAAPQEPAEAVAEESPSDPQ